MSNLVLGAAFGYGIDKVAPFILSFRKYSNDKIVLLVDKINEDMQKFCDNHKVTLFKPKSILNKNYSNGLNVDRYRGYLEITDDFENIDNIFLSDIRDVIFQKNPFENKLKHQIEFFAEPEIFKNCVNHNAPWYINLYGIDEFKKVENEYILCSGTTIGTKKYILRYIEKLLNEISSIEKKGKISLAPDQPVHNKIVYSGEFDDYGINHNGKGLVSTMHHSKKLTFSRKGELLNDDGTPTPVVHQYDRLGAFSTVFLRNAFSVNGKQGVGICANYAINNFFEWDL